ncbi:MAG: hypothetical protein H7843_09095 [Nitrospirota bacterium]
MSKTQTPFPYPFYNEPTQHTHNRLTLSIESLTAIITALDEVKDVCREDDEFRDFIKVIHYHTVTATAFLMLHKPQLQETMEKNDSGELFANYLKIESEELITNSDTTILGEVSNDRRS